MTTPVTHRGYRPPPPPSTRVELHPAVPARNRKRPPKRTAGVRLPDGRKECPACNALLPLSEFHKCSTKPDGRQSYCKSCKRLAQRRDEAAFHARAIKALGGKCVGCTYAEDIRALNPYPAAWWKDPLDPSALAYSRRRLTWLTMFRKALKDPEDYVLLCANCVTIHRHEESLAGGRVTTVRA